ncbi:MAG: PQQ-dependent sugar dehydrogenase [Luteibaculaceae bacterium]
MKHVFFIPLLAGFMACSENITSPENAPTVTPPSDLTRELVVQNLSMPWGMAFINETDVLVTQKSGEIVLANVASGNKETLFTVPNAVIRGQGGLLGIALSPQFEQDRLVYVTYTKQEGNLYSTALGRFAFQNGAVSNFQELHVANGWGTTGLHYGSRIVFDNAGFLYFSIGDRGVMAEAQNTATDNGSILRLNADGTIPADNPFFGQEGFSDATFTFGNRNIQGMAVHPTTGEIWSHEHGPQGGDEINIMIAGENYGWPTVTFGEQYGGGEISPNTSAPGLKDPLHHWTPSIAPCGMAIIFGDKYPGWEGNILTGALAGQHLNRTVFNGTTFVSETRYFEGQGRIRDVVMSPDGFIYKINESDGGIYKVLAQF